MRWPLGSNAVPKDAVAGFYNAEVGDEMTHKEWLSVADLHEWLEIGRNKAYELVQSGELPSYRIGRQIRVRKQHVEEWLESQRYDDSK